MDINLLKKQFNNSIQYQNVCQSPNAIPQEENHPFFNMIKASDKLMGLGRNWEYGGIYFFGESNKMRRMKILRHIYQAKQPRIYHENISSREYCFRMGKKRETNLKLLDNFGTMKIEKIKVVNKRMAKNSKTSKNSGSKGSRKIKSLMSR